MLKQHQFDPHRTYNYADYLRMSTDAQNPRSPDQQSDTIEATLKRCGYPWIRVGEYTDAGISGQYVKKRPGFQRMLADIRSGALGIDLILVDTFERFGRADELAGLRRELHQKYGVLVLTADSQFSDPTTTAGRALAAIESIRSVDDSRIKAHNVLRGQRDAARRGHWPSGVAPFGYKLRSVLKDHNGRQEVDYVLLEPDPETSWIIQLFFKTALANSWGCSRLAKMANNNPEIPNKFKPFYDQTVNYRLKNRIYCGELLWGQHCCGVVDDARVLQRNAEEDMVRIPNFCEPLVTREEWEAVQLLRSARSEQTRRARQAKKAHPGKQIAPLTQGIALRYLLSGLVTCGECNRAMVASSSPIFITKGGIARRYVSYHCPANYAGVCSNSTHVPEAWLRDTVIDLIRHRLFPSAAQQNDL